MEFIQAITDAANEANSPVILQVSSSAIKYARLPYLKKMVEAAVETTNIPIALHLDHGPDFETCKMCIDGGFTSVMIDASSKEFEENVRITREVVEYAHSHGVVVEAELGTLAGVEDEVYSVVDDKYEVLTNASEGTLVFPSLFEIVQLEDKIDVKNVIDLENKKFQTYKDWAEQSNVSICPTVKLNCSMSKVSSSYESRSYVINTLYNTLINNRLTMICIDFTDVDDAEGLYRFIIEMVPRFKCAGMKVLIRNNGVFNVDRIKNIVDYVVY